MAQLSLFTTIDGVNLQKLASSRTTKHSVLRANRGTIYDANGNILAQNILSYTVIAYLDPNRSENSTKPLHVVDKKYTAEKLAPIINMDASYIEELLSREKVTQVELGPGGRGITELTKEKIIALQLPGIDFVESYKRYYPNGRFLSYTLGYAKANDNGEINGELGLEICYNEELKGIDGYLDYQGDRNGYQIPNTKEVRINPVNGKDIYLTIDNTVQIFVESSVKESFEKYGPDWILMVVADAKTGKILASTSYPSFDPNIKDLTNYLDPVVSYAFEPGSTMKTFTYMAAMENHTYNGSDTFQSGSIKIGDDTVNDWNGKGWGTINYDTGFTLSSNVGISNLVQKYIDKDILKNYFQKLGFGKKTNVGLPRELIGKINFRYPIEVATAGFGQGITTTPIQHIQALTSIANNGIMLQPYIIDRIVNSSTDEVVFQGSRKELGRVASTATVNQIKNLMYNVIHGDSSNSTGYIYKVPDLDLIGKTGTAQIADSKGGYMSDAVIRSFAGMYPKDDPKVIIYAAARTSNPSVLINPIKKVVVNTARYLNVTQGNENKEQIINYELPSLINKDTAVIKNTLKEKGIPTVILGNGDRIINQYPEIGTNVTSKDVVFIITNDKNITMPNIVGWSSKEALTLINLLNINYELDGYGFVTKQSISPDTLIKKDDKLIITLKPRFNIQDENTQ
jgi:penicillin-binding protein 2B